MLGSHEWNQKVVETISCNSRPNNELNVKKRLWKEQVYNNLDWITSLTCKENDERYCHTVLMIEVQLAAPPAGRLVTASIEGI